MQLGSFSVLASVKRWAVVMGTLTVAACGSGGDSNNPSYIVQGSVSGLVSGAGLTLQDNGSDSTPISVNASFSFSTRLPSGAAYSVTISSAPSGETCAVSNASGVIGSSNVSVAVICTPIQYVVGGTVAGLLNGYTVVLANNGSDNTIVSTNGNFSFSDKIPSGSPYAVTIATQPESQVCAVAQGSGTVAAANLTNISVTCSPDQFSISATVFGLVKGGALVLRDSTGDTLTISNSGTYAFTTSIPFASNYAVTVATQPSGQQCIVENGSGSVAQAVSVSVVCPWHVVYVPNLYAETVSAYYIDPTTGALYPLTGSPFAAGQYPYAVTLSPNGQFLYVTNEGSSSAVMVFAVDPATGALTPIPGSPFAAGANSQSISIDPTGQFAYVGNLGVQSGEIGIAQEPNGISAYRVNSGTGALTPIVGGQLTNTSQSVSLTVDPSGKFLITAGATYSISPTTGLLTSLGDMGTSGNQSSETVFTTNGAFAYAFDTATGTTGNGSPNLATYSFDSTTGALTSLPSMSFNLSQNDAASAICISPNGQFLYALTYEGSIFAYAVNSTTGELTLISGSPYTVQGFASSIVADPSGTFIYTSNSSEGDIWGFAVDAGTGKLTALAGSPFDAPAFATQGGHSMAIKSLISN